MKSKGIKFRTLCMFFTVAVFTSCKKKTEPSFGIVKADFDQEVILGENQAIVSLTNLSTNATSYEWSFPGGSPQISTGENPTVSYLEKGTYPITLQASNGVETNSKTIDITIDSIVDNGYVPYRYLENDGIFAYYETNNAAIYQSLIPNEFNLPSRKLVHVFINDFYKLDYGATPYKENALFILVEYQGEEFWHCVYMPVTDQRSVTAGRIGLGLPKTLGQVNFTRNDPDYFGNGTNQHGGTMDMIMDTDNFTIDSNVRQELISLNSLRTLQIRNGKIIKIGKTVEGQNSIIETAEQFPNLLTLKFGQPSISNNTDSISFYHPLDLLPSKIIGGYYLKNTIPFSLTGNPL